MELNTFVIIFARKSLFFVLRFISLYLRVAIPVSPLPPNLCCRAACLWAKQIYSRSVYTRSAWNALFGPLRFVYLAGCDTDLVVKLDKLTIRMSMNSDKFCLSVTFIIRSGWNFVVSSFQRAFSLSLYLSSSCVSLLFLLSRPQTPDCQIPSAFRRFGQHRRRCLKRRKRVHANQASRVRAAIGHISVRCVPLFLEPVSRCNVVVGTGIEWYI